jgi:hypothetical protein
MKKPNVRLMESIDSDQSTIDRYIAREELYELQPTAENYRVISCSSHIHIISEKTPLHLTKFEDADFIEIFREIYKNKSINIRMYDKEISIYPLTSPEPCKINDYSIVIGKGKLKVKVDVELEKDKETCGLIKTPHDMYCS